MIARLVRMWKAKPFHRMSEMTSRVPSRKNLGQDEEVISSNVAKVHLKFNYFTVVFVLTF